MWRKAYQYNFRLGFPGMRKAEGPKIFLSRLRGSVQRQSLARTGHFLNPLTGVNLFSNVARDYLRKPYILRLDGIAIDEKEFCGPNDAINAPIVKAIAGASGLIFQSHFSQQMINHHFGRSGLPSRIIPNGTDLKKFCRQGGNKRSILGIPEDARVLLTSASWRAHKRLDAMLESFFALAEEHRDLHMIVVGGAGDEQPQHDRLYYSGFVEPVDLPDWYRTADVYLFLSWLDWCPNSVVEALASGLPVVCSNQGGTRELVERANGGIVVDADEDVAVGMVDLYNPPRPDMQAVHDALNLVLKDIPYYAQVIRRDTVDIDGVAQQYLQHVAACIGRG